MKFLQLYSSQLFTSLLLVGVVGAETQEIAVSDFAVAEHSAPKTEMTNTSVDLVPQVVSVGFQAVMARHRATALVSGIEPSQFAGTVCDIPMSDHEPQVNDDRSCVANALRSLSPSRVLNHPIEMPSYVALSLPMSIFSVRSEDVTVPTQVVLLAGR